MSSRGASQSDLAQLLPASVGDRPPQLRGTGVRRCWRAAIASTKETRRVLETMAAEYRKLAERQEGSEGLESPKEWRCTHLCIIPVRPPSVQLLEQPAEIVVRQIDAADRE